MIGPASAIALLAGLGLGALFTWALTRRRCELLVGQVAAQGEAARRAERALQRLRVQLGEQSAIASVARDVREREARVERQLEADRAETVGSLVAGLGHELNNPLTYILSNLDYALEALAGRDEASELQEVLGDAREGCRRLGMIIRPLRTFARTDRDGFEPVELDEAIADGLEAAREEHPVLRSVRWQPPGLPTVVGGREQLVLVFLSALRGAARATSSGGWVRIETAVSGDTARVSIVHEGAGLRDDALCSYICREIVRVHGGELQVVSAPGEGTRVTVSLPVAEAVTAAPVAAGLRPRVMVVDDDTRLAALLCRWLEDADYETARCADASLALEELRAGERADLIVCDLGLPGMSGMAFYEALRRVDPRAAERVRFLTGGPYSADSARFMEAMSSRCMEKPIQESEMLDWVRGALG